jgi:RNA polymerase sigma-70 factor (ECF subfamily)
MNRVDGRSIRSWWYRFASNLRLNHVSRESFAAAHGITRADDPWWLEPCPDSLLDTVQLGQAAQYDNCASITLSFVAGLQHLPAKQRSVLVLRDVLGFTAAEAAEILGTTTVTVDAALARARDGFRPDPHPDDITAPDSSAEAAVVDRFIAAFQSGDVHRVVQILSDDARLSMPAAAVQCTGPTAVAAHLRSRGFWGPQLSLIPTRANGQPAFGYYLPASDDGCLRLRGLIVLTITDERVSTVTRFGGEVVHHFDLPLTVDHPGIPG